VREAVDFLRYYASQAREQFAQPETLPGPTGEIQRAAAARPRRVRLHQPVELPAGDLPGPGRAALAAGNSVIAKPAEQTTLVGHAAVKLLHEAGVPEDVLQFVPGDGATVGARQHPATRGWPAWLHRLHRNRLRPSTAPWPRARPPSPR
jgi:RHH-type proline utilization regulon transcriptional repressor/proline dehydrogenase/delta 1-pyrroline-5-carboxylate dehydrogenase